MPQLLEHCAVTRPWTMAASQAVALLGFDVLLRSVVS